MSDEIKKNTSEKEEEVIQKQSTSSKKKKKDNKLKEEYNVLDKESNLEDEEQEEDLLSDEEDSEAVLERVKEDCKIILATYVIEDLNKYVNNKLKKIKKELDKLDASKVEDVEVIKRLTEEYSNIQRIFNHYTDQLVFNRDTLQKINELKYKLSPKHTKYNVSDLSPNVDIDKIDSSKLSKSDITTLILATEGDLIKIPLLNSGFNILLRDAGLSELNLLFNKLQEKMNEYGRMFGALFFLFSDLYIKEELLDFIEKLIVKSNLKNWNKGMNFRKSLSIHDYEVILHGIATLMYPEGYTYRFNCPNPNCNYSEEIKIKLQLMKQYNFDIIPEDCLGLVTSNEQISFKTYQEYQNKLELLESVKVHNKYLVHLHVPTMYEYLQYGKEFNDNMFKVVQLGDKTQIDNYIQYNYLKIFAPWITHIDILDKQGNVKLSVKDRNIILSILEIIQKDEDGLSDKIIDFIKKSKITHICYPVNPCPECKQIPSGAINGLIPFDVQNNFFSQCLMRLIQLPQQKNN